MAGVAVATPQDPTADVRAADAMLERLDREAIELQLHSYQAQVRLLQDAEQAHVAALSAAVEQERSKAQAGTVRAVQAALGRERKGRGRQGCH